MDEGSSITERIFVAPPIRSNMGQEIERKFLTTGDDWRAGAEGTAFRQGYLVADAQREVRVRRAGDRAFLTIKGPRRGNTRTEIEYPISGADADQLLDELCDKPLIEKTRFRVEHEGHTWEIDDFHGDNTGLVLAEVELDSEDEQVHLPPWIGTEVSDDPRFTNAHLARHPYSSWS